MAELLHIEVVFAGVDRALRKSVQVEQGATVADALRMSAIAADLGVSEIDPAHVGVFGRVAGPGTLLRDGDRVEIYRALNVDPKEARRLRARK